MTPDLTYQIAVNATNVSSIPIMLNITLNPIIDATLNQSQEPIYETLLKNGGTFLAGIIALISFWWVNLRGPRIVCSPIRYMTLIRTPSSSNMIPKFILSNIGGSSGVIEFLAVNLERISPEHTKLRFVSFYDGSIENITPQAFGSNQITSLDSPVLPFIIENGKGTVKIITFANDSSDFNFIAGRYNIEIRIKLQHRRQIIRHYFNIFIRILSKLVHYFAEFNSYIAKLDKYLDKKIKGELTVLSQSFTIADDIQVATARSAMIIDPVSGILEF
jgi:hypothetical protein